MAVKYGNSSGQASMLRLSHEIQDDEIDMFLDVVSVLSIVPLEANIKLQHTSNHGFRFYNGCIFDKGLWIKRPCTKPIEALAGAVAPYGDSIGSSDLRLSHQH